MTVSDDLTIWFRSQLDWQEQLAQRALQADPIDFVGLVSPRWMLREVEAKRRILELHESSHECSTIERWVDCEDKPVEEISYCTWVVDGGCTTVKLLALPDADRPGYREEWRP